MKSESAKENPATADSAVALKPSSDELRVKAMVVREGGVELGFEGVKTHLPGVVKGLEMFFDKRLGSILIHWNGRQPDGKHALRRIGVPLSNVKQFELA